MIQGGDFTSFDGKGGYAAHATNNGSHTFHDENFDVSHNSEGILSMANKGRNTNGSQFFITLGKCLHLDKKHVAFGKVLHGMDVIQQASNVDTDGDKPIMMQRVIIVDCGIGKGDNSSKDHNDGSSSSSDDSSSSSSISASSASSSSDERKRKKRKRSKSKKRRKRRNRDDDNDDDDDDSSSYHKRRKKKSKHNNKKQRYHKSDRHKKKKRKTKRRHSRDYSSEEDAERHGNRQLSEKRLQSNDTCDVNKKESSAAASLQQHQQPFSTTEATSKHQPTKQSKGPMTQAQYLELQSQIREVIDPVDGRKRLVRGTGEIIERIVSRAEHSRINQGATLGDGSGYARDIMKAAAAMKKKGG